MYKSRCSKCSRVFETEQEYYNFICDGCAEEAKKRNEARDRATLRKLFKDMVDAIAEGAPQSDIDVKTQLYEAWAAHMRNTYGSDSLN